MSEKKVTFDPDKLNLTKKDLIAFCDNCVNEWKKNRTGNFRYIVAMSIMKSQIVITPESVLKAIWGKIISWFYELNYENAIKDPTDEGMKFIKKLREKKND
jgi:hypothetical protein|tara:strand:- start:3212 stop:3514 length:303 start_codon:yes stop_codon:yes gene_type:complete